jgi:hypothetical protein
MFCQQGRMPSGANRLDINAAAKAALQALATFEYLEPLLQVCSGNQTGMPGLDWHLAWAVFDATTKWHCIYGDCMVCQQLKLESKLCPVKC